MVTKRMLCGFLCFTFFSIFLNSEENTVYYSFTENKDEITFTQTLAWDTISYAKYYEVLLEKKESSGNWQIYEIYETELNTIEISLPVGIYRYNISVWNPLNRKEPASDWYEFKILQAINPVVYSIEPEKWYLSKEQDGIFTIESEGILPETEIVLERLEDSFIFPVSIYDITGAVTTIHFDEKAILAGDYLLRVTNPSGLFDASKLFSVQQHLPCNFAVSFGYFPSFCTGLGDLGKIFKNTISLMGLNLKLALFPFIRDFGSMGFELVISFQDYEKETDSYTCCANIVPLIFSFVYQYPIIKDRLVVDANIGLGTTYIYHLGIEDTNLDANNNYLSTIAITPSLGISLQGFLIKGLYIELGVDTSFHILSGGSFLQDVSPSISIGYKF